MQRVKKLCLLLGSTAALGNAFEVETMSAPVAETETVEADSGVVDSEM